MRLVVIVDSPLFLEHKYTEELKAVSNFVRKKSTNKNNKLSKFEIDKLSDLDEIYDVILNKVNTPIYQVLNKKYDELIRFRDNFIKLEKEEKCKIIFELLHLFQCNAVYSDLQLIGGVSKFGRLSITKSLKEYDKMSIIHQSPSGIFEHEIELTSL